MSAVDEALATALDEGVIKLVRCSWLLGLPHVSNGSAGLGLPHVSNGSAGGGAGHGGGHGGGHLPPLTCSQTSGSPAPLTRRASADTIPPPSPPPPPSRFQRMQELPTNAFATPEEAVAAIRRAPLMTDDCNLTCVRPDDQS